MRISYYETSWVQLWVTSFLQEVLLENELADSRNDSDPPLKTFPLKKEVELRFLHFKLVDFWGKGGGLQYFFVEPGEIVLLTIQALFDQSSGFRESEKFFLDSDCPNLPNLPNYLEKGLLSEGGGRVNMGNPSLSCLSNI